MMTTYKKNKVARLGPGICAPAMQGSRGLYPKVKEKNRTFLPITLANVDRLSKFFPPSDLAVIVSNELIIKDPTTPQTRRYATLKIDKH